MIRFIHTADIHYGMENYGKIDAATGIHSRLLDFDRAFNFCVDTAINQNVDFFLIAGDAYKTTNPSPTQQRLFFNALFRLHAAQIPVVIIIGNHDNPLSFGKASTLDILADIPLLTFHVMSKPRALTLQTKSGPVNIVGIPWPTRNTIALSDNFGWQSIHELNEKITHAVNTLIKQLAQELDPALPAVLTAHLTVSSGIFSGSEKRAIYGHDPLFLPSDLAIAPFDYVALGHLHRYQQLNPDNYPPIVYSGSPERIDFGERKEQKGFCLVSIENKKAAVTFIETPQRPFVQLELTLESGTISQTQQIIQALSRYTLDDAIVKIIYHVPAQLKDTVDIQAVQKACAPAHDLIGIIPVHAPKQRVARTALRVDMDFEKLLDSYLIQKNESVERRQQLIKRALEIQQELADEREEA
ncbi:MAG: exonuclease SbcCD subunit D [Candidatus Babeliales bacterium]